MRAQPSKVWTPNVSHICAHRLNHVLTDLLLIFSKLEKRRTTEKTKEFGKKRPTLSFLHFVKLWFCSSSQVGNLLIILSVFTSLVKSFVFQHPKSTETNFLSNAFEANVFVKRVFIPFFSARFVSFCFHFLVYLWSNQRKKQD